MRKGRVYLYIGVLCISLIVLFQQDGLARESEKNLGDSIPRNVIKAIRPSDTEKIDLRKIKKIAILVTSTSPLFGGIAEDHLAIKLRDKGFDVIEKSEISERTQEELLKQEIESAKKQVEFEKQLEKEKGTASELELFEKRLEQREEQLKKGEGTSQEEILNLIHIGGKLGLDAVFMGTLFEGRRELNFAEKDNQFKMENIAVSTFYLQIMDIETQKVVLLVVAEYEQGESIVNAIDTMTEYLLKEIE